MVDNYRPEVEELEQWLDELEDRVFRAPSKDIIREILDVKRDVTGLRRIATPQRDALGRLARREFPMIATSWRTGSATYTTTSCALPMRRSSSRIA